MAVHAGTISGSIGPLHVLKQLAPAQHAPVVGTTAIDPPRSETSRPPRIAPPCPLTDSRQCRIWLNEARREIDLLRRGQASQSDAPGDARSRQTIEGHGSIMPGEASLPREPLRLYAPTLLGRVELPDVPEPLEPQMVALTRTLQVTNLGTLIDALI